MYGLCIGTGNGTSKIKKEVPEARVSQLVSLSVLQSMRQDPSEESTARPKVLKRCTVEEIVHRAHSSGLRVSQGMDGSNLRSFDAAVGLQD